jgi:hypothetical protein
VSQQPDDRFARLPWRDFHDLSRRQGLPLRYESMKEDEIMLHTDSLEPWTAPLPCPQCADSSGMPVTTSTTQDRERISIRLRCSACRYEWDRDLQYLPLFLPQEAPRGVS